jgi:hypothetical protein
MLLLAHLRLDDAGVAEWFDDYKPYTSFAGKIRGAHERGLIADHTRDDLLVIREIRTRSAIWLKADIGSFRHL